MLLLAGDIGGTKTDLAIYSDTAGPHEPLTSTTVSSADYPNLETAAIEFVLQAALQVDAAAFGVAGPVVDGKATGTNLPWTLDERLLAEALELEVVTLLNDLQAIANAVPHLTADDLLTLNQGVPTPHGPLAVVAPGTGLGEAFLTWENGRYKAHPSEGGHADFSPNTELETALLSYLRDRYGHVSVERVCSGRWLINIYEFLRDEGHVKEPDWMAAKLADAQDPTPVIVSAALDSEPCELCQRTVEMLVGVLGAEAGDLALTVMATGGVYLGGGMPPHLLPFLKSDRFMEAFRSKGRLSYIVENVPVHVILNPKAGLLGAAAFGIELLSQ
jgi:glucokinase